MSFFPQKIWGVKIALGLSCAYSLLLPAESVTNPLVGEQQHTVALRKVDSFTKINSENSTIYYNSEHKPQSTLYINFLVQNINISEHDSYHLVGARFSPNAILHSDPEVFLRFIKQFTDILKYKYPQRFIVERKGCLYRKNDFFQCLHDKNINWATHFYVNDGEIEIRIYPVVDQKTERAIGGSLVVIYHIGTGRYLEE